MVDTFDRLEGARSTFGVKKPVRVASTGALTLSGFQTIDEIVLGATDHNLRVLVKDQADATQNGIYEAASSEWARTKDFDGNTDWVEGTLVEIQEGTYNGRRFFRVDSSDPPAVATSNISFSAYTLDNFTRNGVDVASATTIDLDDIDSDFVTITGTTQINNIVLSPGRTRFLRFTGSLTLSNISSNEYLGGGDGTGTVIITRPGDFMMIRSYDEGVFAPDIRLVFYTRKDGHPMIAQELELASTGTMPIDQNAGGSQQYYAQCLKITGTTTINSFGDGDSTPVGAIKVLRFESALTVAGINGVGTGLPDGQSIAIAANDVLILRRDADQTWRVIGLLRADLHALTTAHATLASAATTELGSLRAQSIGITGTTGITSFGTTAPTGAIKFLSFAGSLLLTHNGTSMILPGGQSLQMFAGDRVIARHEGSGNWRILVLQRVNASVSSLQDVGTSTTGEDTLLSATIPAGRLASSVDAIRVRAWGQTSGTTQAKRIRLYFGTALIADSSNRPLNAASWEVEALITRQSSLAQRSVGRILSNSTELWPAISVQATTLDLSSTLSISLTGACTGSTSIGEITARGLVAEYLGH